MNDDCELRWGWLRFKAQLWKKPAGLEYQRPQEPEFAERQTELLAAHPRLMAASSIATSLRRQIRN